MAQRGFGYFDRKGEFFKTASEATRSDLISLLEEVGAGSAEVDAVANALIGRRGELERIFSEHDEMVSDEDERAAARASDEAPAKTPVAAKPEASALVEEAAPAPAHAPAPAPTPAPAHAPAPGPASAPTFTSEPAAEPDETANDPARETQAPASTTTPSQVAESVNAEQDSAGKTGADADAVQSQPETPEEPATAAKTEEKPSEPQRVKPTGFGKKQNTEARANEVQARLQQVQSRLGADEEDDDDDDDRAEAAPVLTLTPPTSSADEAPLKLEEAMQVNEDDNAAEKSQDASPEQAETEEKVAADEGEAKPEDDEKSGFRPLSEMAWNPNGRGASLSDITRRLTRRPTG